MGYSDVTNPAVWGQCVNQNVTFNHGFSGINAFHPCLSANPWPKVFLNCSCGSCCDQDGHTSGHYEAARSCGPSLFRLDMRLGAVAENQPTKNRMKSIDRFSEFNA